MKRLFSIAAAVVFAAMMGISTPTDSSGGKIDSVSKSDSSGDRIDSYIRDLKSDNPEVRVKAAHELGCG